MNSIVIDAGGKQGGSAETPTLTPWQRRAETSNTNRPRWGWGFSGGRHLLQHRAQLDAGLADRASTAAAATTNAGGRTPWRFAQASFSVWVWQQHCRQQVAASEQPHAQLSHGNRSPLCFGVAAGSGMPIPATATASSVSAAAPRRRLRRQNVRTRRTTGSNRTETSGLSTPTVWNLPDRSLSHLPGLASVGLCSEASANYNCG
jgi:hypothetical protein